MLSIIIISINESTRILVIRHKFFSEFRIDLQNFIAYTRFFYIFDFFLLLHYTKGNFDDDFLFSGEFDAELMESQIMKP